MTYAVPRTGRNFSKRLVGYDRSEVDAFVSETVEATDALRAQLGQAAEADPMSRIGTEIASLLRSLADSVAEMHDDAERRAAELVREATDEAERRHAAAEAEANELIRQADLIHKEAADKLESATREAAQMASEVERRAERFVRDQLNEARSQFEVFDQHAELSEREVVLAAEHLETVLSKLRMARQVVQDLEQPEAATGSGDASVGGGQIADLTERGNRDRPESGDHVSDDMSAHSGDSMDGGLTAMVARWTHSR